MAFLTGYGTRKPVTHPFSNYTVVMFVQGHVTGFYVCVIRVVKKRRKATTRNGVPQGIGRPQHIPTKNDTVVMFVRGNHTFIAIV